MEIWYAVLTWFVVNPTADTDSVAVAVKTFAAHAVSEL